MVQSVKKWQKNILMFSSAILPEILFLQNLF